MNLKKSLLLALMAGFVAGSFAVCDVVAGPKADNPVAAEKKKKKKKKKRRKRDPETQFKRLDKDKNGFVSKTEFLGKRKGKGLARAEKRWTRMQKFAVADKEKGLNLEEFKKANTRKKRKKKKKKKS